MKYVRYIWIIILLILLILAGYAFLNWKQVKPYFANLAQHEIISQKNAQGEASQTADITGAVSSKAITQKPLNDKKQIEEKETQPLTFQLNNLSADGGQVAGLGPVGWDIELLSGETLLAKTSANKKDGRWVIILDKGQLPAGKTVLSLRATSLDQKETILSSDKLELNIVEPKNKPEKEPEPKAVLVSDKKEDTPQKTKDLPVVEQRKKNAPKPIVVAASSKANEKTQAASEVFSFEDIVITHGQKPKRVLSLKGKAKAGTLIKAYLNGKLIGTSKVSTDGTWLFKQSLIFNKLVQVVKVEQIGDQGQVLAMREKSVKVELLKETVSKELKARSTRGIRDKSAIKQSGNSSANRVHVVVAGDSLWKIALKYYGNGDMYWRIYRANSRKIRHVNLIYPGQRFRLP